MTTKKAKPAAKMSAKKRVRKPKGVSVNVSIDASDVIASEIEQRVRKGLERLKQADKPKGVLVVGKQSPEMTAALKQAWQESYRGMAVNEVREAENLPPLPECDLTMADFELPPMKSCLAVIAPLDEVCPLATLPAPNPSNIVPCFSPWYKRAWQSVVRFFNGGVEGGPFEQQ